MTPSVRSVTFPYCLDMSPTRWVARDQRVDTMTWKIVYRHR